MAKVDIVNVPYNGGAPATMAAVGGHTSMLVTNIIEAAEQVKAGQAPRHRGDDDQALRGAAAGADGGGVGLSRFDAGNWFGAVVRTGTPEGRHRSAQRRDRPRLELPEVRETLVQAGPLARAR